MDAVRFLSLLRPHLETCGARWMLAGGFALAACGSTRATADLDLIWVEGETSRRLFSASRERSLPGGTLERVPAPEHLVEMKVKAIRSRPTRVFRDGEDLRVLLGIEGIDQNAAREAFVRAGLVELWDRLRP
jgi:hypothetical protein